MPYISTCLYASALTLSTHLLVLVVPLDLGRRFTLDVDIEEHLLGGSGLGHLQVGAVNARSHCKWMEELLAFKRFAHCH